MIKLVAELFQQVLGWERGVQFQVVAFQAVTASQIQGDTIHHACGIPVFGRERGHEEAAQHQQDVAKRVLQWRWLIIDEISMVSAKLLAEMDVKLRSVVRRIGTAKLDEQGIDRPFGGLNVLFCGDFWQLPPPDGGFLGNIPTEFIQRGRKFSPAPSVSHGQSLFWSSKDNGLQGVTELIQCERCADPWLRQVQNEMRRGHLSEDSYNFLHGKDTIVAGSWVNGKVTCGKRACEKLCKSAASGSTNTEHIAKRIRARECTECQAERASKHLVASGFNDPRFNDERFLNAPGIFPNNDVKFQANKSRAKVYAMRTNAAITHSVAKDTPTPDAINENPDLRTQKLSWLQGHDRERGDLYGMLPLILSLIHI